jgi:hypothetical protein
VPLARPAVVRILFGVIWAIDATFKWLPGFIHGQTLGHELGAAADVHTPIVHQWISMWHSIGTANPSAFAIGTAIIETLIAIGLIGGAYSNLVWPPARPFRHAHQSHHRRPEPLIARTPVGRLRSARPPHR